MTDTRKKLVELLKTNACPSPFICDQACKYYGYGDCFPDRFADYLIANGVTVQEWIPVTERLPEPKHEFDARNWYLVALSNGVVKELAYEFHSHSVFGHGWRETTYPVTHWMELPHPPKGE